MSALEQVVGFPLSVFKKAEDEVDEVIEQSLIVGLPDAAIQYGWQLIAGGHLSGIKLCKLLYELTEMWPRFQTSDDIKDAVFKGMGVPTETYRKYEGVWRSIFANENIDKRVREMMRNKPMRGLIGIAAAARNGEFTEQDWNDLATSHDVGSMLEVRDRARGIERHNSNRRIVTWERDGRLTVRRGSEGPEEWGLWPKDAASDLVKETILWAREHLGVAER